MKLKNIEEVNEFLSIVNQCRGDVYLLSLQGDRFNLKSKLTQFVAMGALLGEHGEELELFCDDKADESKFLKYFCEHPDTI